MLAGHGQGGSPGKSLGPAPEEIDPQPHPDGENRDADVLRNAHPRAEHRRLVDANDLEQEPRNGMKRQHQRRQFAVAALEGFVDQKQRAEQQGVEETVELVSHREAFAKNASGD